MTRNRNRRGQQTQAASSTTSTPTRSDSSGASVNVDPKDKKELTDAVNNILRGIPFIGPYIVIIKLKWGWSGILLLLGGISNSRDPSGYGPLSGARYFQKIS